MEETVLRFTQEQFDAFGRLSGDLNPIHVDPGFSASTRFGRTVAHGMMLFAVIGAAIARSMSAPVRINGQELMFPSPTFAGVDHVLRIDRREDALVTASIATHDGTTTALSRTWLSAIPGLEPRGQRDGAVRLKHMRLGDQARLVRRFHPSDTAELVQMLNDPNPLHQGPDATLPPALLGGLISCLLGMSLPGPGTNWLKQRYVFHRQVPVDAEVAARVRVVRLRPDKDLVDLECDCQVDGETVMTGDSLVLARDVGIH